MVPSVYYSSSILFYSLVTWQIEIFTILQSTLTHLIEGVEVPLALLLKDNP